MSLNVIIQLCKVTRASKLFQRNFYLPLLRPLSPKDALRRHIITGKNMMGRRIEHYIPVLESYRSRMQKRKYKMKGKGKKRQRKKESMKYRTPFFDDEMENHAKLKELLAKKCAGRGQCYTYYISDKNCTVVLPYQMERAIRDKDIVDVMIAQRSEKIIVKLRNGITVALALVSYDGKTQFYSGEGWTREDIEEYHHHGKDTFYNVNLFEGKEAGIEEWELDMMRLANKRKKAFKGEGTADWKGMISSCVENMDWDDFEEETRQIVAEINEPIDDQPIPMQVIDMDKTKDANQKLKAAGEEILRKLPVMAEIPELIKIVSQGELTEISDVSGVSITLPSSGKECFVVGQKVTSEEGELFVPGQTVETENGITEYVPGFTIFMDNEPTLFPGLVMGDDPNKPMFLPGESAITASGELQFVETEDDIRHGPTPTESEEEELDESSEEEKEQSVPLRLSSPPLPPPKRKSAEFVYERPKRLCPNESQMPKKKEKREKKTKTKELKPVSELLEIDLSKPVKNRFDPKDPVLFDLSLPTFEKELLDQERERVGKLSEKKSKEELVIDRRKREIKAKVKEILKIPPPVKYEPLDPIKKSAKLKEYEKEIKRGKFFDVDHKKFLNKYNQSLYFNWVEPYEYRNTFDSVGLERHRIWKSVY